MSEPLEDETISGRGPQCPWCMYQHEADPDWGEEGEDDCAECGKPFTWRAEYSVDYWASQSCRNHANPNNLLDLRHSSLFRHPVCCRALALF